MTLLAATTAERRRIRTAWIAAHGRPIALYRKPDTISDGAGSMIAPTAVRDTRMAARNRVLKGLSMVGRGVNQMPERWYITSQGERQKVVYVLIGTHDDDMRRHDYWLNEYGDKLEIVFVHEDKIVQVKAEIVLIAS